MMRARAIRSAVAQWILLGSATIVALGCTAPLELVPERATFGLAALPGSSGAGRDADVQVVVTVGAWRGDPEDLADDVEPLYLEIENRSSSALWIQYSNLALVAPRKRFACLPPFDVESDESKAHIPTEPEPTRFRIAPYHHRFMPRHTPIIGEFPQDPAYFKRQHAKLVDLGLPTDAMLKAALPEGLLEPGGRLTGFIYVEDPRSISKAEAKARFELELVRPPFGESFGRIEVPFTFR